MKPNQRARSAETGKWVKEAQARRDPARHVIETIRPAKPSTAAPKKGGGK